MTSEPDYKECTRILEEALATMQYLSLYACTDERQKLEITCERLLNHIIMLRTE